MLDNDSAVLRDILLSAGLCDEAQMNDVEEEVRRSGKAFMDVVVNYGFCSREDFLYIIAANLGTEVVDLSQFSIRDKVVKMIDSEMARSYGVVPLSFDGNVLRVVAKNPFNYQMIEELQFIIGHEVMVMVADPEQIDQALTNLYPESTESVKNVLDEMKRSIGDVEDEDQLSNMGNETPIVKFVDLILSQAIRDKASDIHFEPFEHDFRIRYCIDGTLHELPTPAKALAIPVISRIKIISNLNISERRLPQDGRIQKKVNGQPVDFRVSSLPTTYGESVVLRVLDRSAVNLDLSVLGFRDETLEKLREIIHMPNGILLVTGPTGSGKTTTLYSALKEINTIDSKLLTAEDPVEYDIEGIIQVPINDAVGMTFNNALRAFLRQDPDRILVGEIRDYETAKIAIEASLTGHFVFSTLHTNVAASTVTRLIDMGVEPFLICSSLVAVLSQRLVRRICPYCKVSYDPTDEELESLHMTRKDVEGKKFYYGTGCAQCNNTGYKGRKSICELMEITPELAELISAIAPTSEINAKAREVGMRTIREDGMIAVYDGTTTVSEILRVTK